MQGETLFHDTEGQMTLTPPPTSDFDSPILKDPLQTSTPTVKFSSPLTSHSQLRNQNILKNTSGSFSSKSHRLRLSKILSKDSFREKGGGEDDGRGEIRVLSPSLVNSQVLTMTRPLSPPPHFIPSNGQQDENDVTAFKMICKEAGGKKRQDGKTKSPKDEAEKDATKNKGRGRRRPRLFKLKFHHQALPPEYLDHYEASLRQERYGPTFDPKDVRETLDAPDLSGGKGLQSGLRQNKGKGGRVRGSRPITIHQAGGDATEALLRDLLLSNPQIQQAALQQAAIARAQSVPSIMMASAGQNQSIQFHSPLTPPSPDQTVIEDQSSYASDMSVDEFPKKTKKPKKNGLNRHVGRILGGRNMGVGGDDMGKSSQMISDDINNPTLATQYVALEKEALARSRSYGSIINPYDQNEPLNLCVRDKRLNPPDNLIQDNSYSYQTPIKDEPTSPLDEENKRPELRKEFEDYTPKTPSSPPDVPAWNFGGCPIGAPHWLHDYRLKTEDGLSSGQSTPSLCSQSSHLPCLSPPTWPHFSPPPHSPSPAPPLSPLTTNTNSRHIQALLKESLQQKLEEAARERLTPGESRLTPRESLIGSPDRHSRTTPTLQSLRETKTGARRKRSALFVPPADPSTEVSICKFKFTGGANPMLEEKKMVSVDAGGTLRYYSGRGADRVMSRHTAPNVRLTGKILENLTKCEKDVKKIRLESDTEDTSSLPGGRLEASCSSATTSPTATLEHGAQSPLQFPPPIEDSPKRKRRSKKSSVREKLEQTLREKGLLIQTQQVESAEGATYCKFRQLRKITRYLFRSWKDYLPGHLNEGVPPGGEQVLSDQRPPSGYCHGGSPHAGQYSASLHLPSTNH